MIQVDFARMLSAIATTEWQTDGYRNRQTGEIVFVSRNDGDAEAWAGREAAVDMVFDRAAVQSNPLEWVKIPHYDREAWGKNREKEFIDDFFRENGIEAGLI